MAIDCLSVKQHIAKGINYHDFMGKQAKTLLAEHLRALMSMHARLKDRHSIAAAAGISPRSVGYMLQPGTGNPTLANIEAVAKAFEVPVWELLIDQRVERERLMSKVFGSTATEPDREKGKSGTTLHEPRRAYKN